MAIDAGTPLEQQEHPIIWVRPNSHVQGIASALVSSIEEDRKITLRAIGAGAVNQAIKSIINARQQLAGRGEDLIVKPGFMMVPARDGGDDVAAIVLHCLLLD